MIIIEGYEEIKIMENKELKERFIDERIEIEYTLQGDCYILNITIPKTRRTGNIGKYGRLKLNYMQMQKCLYKLYHLHIRNQLQSR